MKKKILSLLLLGFLLTSTASLYVGSIVQMNADQAQISQYLAKLQQPGQTFSFGNFTFSVELTLLAYHHSDLFPRQNLIDQGWIPDCRSFCFQGIHYFIDPTTLITNQGRGVIQCLVY